MSEPLLTTHGLCKRFGGITATDDLSLDIHSGDIHAIIGPNGAGKTTLVAQLSGMLKPDAGRIHFEGKDITNLPAPKRAQRGLTRSFQVTSILKDFSCLDNVALAVQAVSGHSFRFWRPAREETGLREPARALLDDVGLQQHADTLAGNLAHGQQRQLEIAIALATRPRLLLLDEPMAGMGAEERALMTRYLKTIKQQYTMLLVEHDMDAVFALADTITVLVYGKCIATGTPEEIRANQEVRQAYLGEG